MVGLLRGRIAPPKPAEVFVLRESTKASAGSWQPAHAIDPSFERRLSKKSLRPRSTLACVSGLSAGIAGGNTPFGSRIRSSAYAALLVRPMTKDAKTTNAD